MSHSETCFDLIRVTVELSHKMSIVRGYFGGILASFIRVISTSAILFASVSSFASVELGRCIKKDEQTNTCLEQELVPSDKSQNIVDNCTEEGGTFDSFGSCIVDPQKFQAKSEGSEVMDPKPAYQGLLAFVKKCEDVSKNAVSVCRSSSSMLERAHSQLNRFNAVLLGQSSMSPAAACTGMQDSVSSSQMQMGAWQQTCGQALNVCEQTCVPTLVSVQSKADLAEMTRKAMRACDSFKGQREDVARSISMATNAIQTSNLCRQQIGGDQLKNRNLDTQRADNTAKPSDGPKITDLNIQSMSPPNFTAPPQNSQTTARRVETTMNHEAVRRQAAADRVLQQKNAIAKAQSQNQNDSRAQAKSGAHQAGSAAAARFPAGVARGTLDGTQVVGNNSKGWPIPVTAAVPSQEAAMGGFGPAARGLPTAVHNGFAAIAGGAKKKFESYGPKTREPSSVETISYRHLGISGRGGNMFFNVRGTYQRIVDSLM